MNSILVLLSLSTAGLVVLVFLWFVPIWQVKRTKGVDPTKGETYLSLVNATRQTWAQVIGGLFFLVTAYFTWRGAVATDQNVTIANENLRIANQNLEVEKSGQITDRFTKAVEQLGATGADPKTTMPERIGAIYALERVALDSPTHHWPVVQVLSAYARINGKWSGKRKASDPYPEDLANILLVLGRRDRSHPEFGQVDLRFMDLTGADLQGLHLENTYLYGAHLEGAYLVDTHFDRATLDRAHLERTDFTHCDINQKQLDTAYCNQATLVKPPLHITAGPPATSSQAQQR